MKKQRNIHRSEHDWRTILQTFSQSGLTQDEFCRHHQLAPSTFAKWKKELGLTLTASTSDFVEVNQVLPARQSATTNTRLELSVAFGHHFQLQLKVA